MKKYSKILCILLAMMFVLTAVSCTKSAPAPTAAPAATPAAATQAAATTAPKTNVPSVLKVGYMSDLTGTSATGGMFKKNGWTLYLKQHDQKLGGMKVEYIVEDLASDAAVAVTKAQKLVENDKVDILVGACLANEAFAIAAYAVEKKVPYFMDMPSAEALTQHMANKYVFRCTWTSGQPQYGLVDYMYNTAGIRTVAVVANDYAFEYEQVGAMKLAFEKLGGKITNIQWVPLTGKDFGAYVSAIPKDVDAIYTGIVGGNGPTFIQELSNYGLTKNHIILASGSITDECYLDAMGDAGIGVLSGLQWSSAIGSPASDAYVQAYKNEYGSIASYTSEASYVCGILLDKMYSNIIASGGDVKNIDDMNKAYTSLKIDAPRGPVTIDSYRHPIENIYIRKVEKTPNGKYGNYQNTVVKTINNVSQWGPYTPEQRLALPQFTKDWPFNAK